MSKTTPPLRSSNALSPKAPTAGEVRRFVHWVDTWSKLTKQSFVLCVWLAGVGSLIWFIGSLTQEGSVDSVYFAVTSLFIFGGTGLATVMYQMLLVPYIRKTDRGLGKGRAGVELLATAGEFALAITLGAVLDGGISSSESSSRVSGGGSFGGGGASGRW